MKTHWNNPLYIFRFRSYLRQYLNFQILLVWSIALCLSEVQYVYDELRYLLHPNFMTLINWLILDFLLKRRLFCLILFKVNSWELINSLFWRRQCFLTSFVVILSIKVKFRGQVFTIILPLSYVTFHMQFSYFISTFLKIIISSYYYFNSVLYCRSL